MCVGITLLVNLIIFGTATTHDDAPNAIALSPTAVFTSANGFKLPVLGFGTFQITEGMESSFHAALEAGYRLFDTATMYENEAVIGKVLSEWFTSGKLKREDLFITSKLPVQGTHPEKVKGFLQQSLKALNLDYLDLYLIHFPVGINVDVVYKADGSLDDSQLNMDMNTDHIAIWKEMEKQVDSGLTKAIGVANFNIKQVERILNISRIPPANVQTEINLFHQDKDMQEFCHKKGITLTAYAPLGSTGTSKSIIKYTVNPMEQEDVLKIAAAHNKSPAQVLLRHLLQCGVAVIPKSSNPKRQRENRDVFDFELTADEIKTLNALDIGEAGRRFKYEYFKSHPEYPFPN